MIGVILTVMALPVMIFVMSLYGAWANTYVLLILLDWFLPVSLHVYIPDFWIVAGLSLIVSYLTQHNIPRKADYQEDLDERKFFSAHGAYILLRPWTILLIGWLIHNRFWLF